MRCGLWAASLGVGLTALLALRAQDPAGALDKKVLEAEAKRAAVIEKVKPSVTAIFSRGGQGGGSGVVVTKDGYALTNFHVVEGAGNIMQCGLPDGVLYDGVLVGLDKVGDVALVKLLPKKEGVDFPFAPLGDSDKVKAGDWSLAMGNPFLLATDFTPTVTFGLVSGVHRYQYPAGTLLEYTDCIQIDTSINPGNSGGPLFNMDGELIGINGRGSFEKRGRVNSGVGYAISINQIKNFMGHMRAGLDTDHATLGATVKGDTDEGEAETSSLGKLMVNSIIDESDVHRRGLDEGDEVISFAGRSTTSVNQYKNVLGLYPKGWRMPLVYRHENERREILVRLMQLRQSEQPAEGDKPKPGPGLPKIPQAPSPASKFFETKEGYANFYFNKLERDRLLAAFKKHGDFSAVAGEWSFEAEAVTKQKRSDTKFVLREEKDGKNIKTKIRLTLSGIDYDLDPLNGDQDVRNFQDPPGSGGLLLALYHYRRFLVSGMPGFERGFSHGGQEPFYPPPPAGQTVKSLADLRVDTEVLHTGHEATTAKWYFSLKDQTLLGFEVWLKKEEDPCEVYLSDYKLVDGRNLPHRLEVRHGNDQFGVFTIKSYQLAAAK